MNGSQIGEGRTRIPISKLTPSSRQRNEIVAALADEVLIIHAESGGSVARISEMVDCWKIPRRDLTDATPAAKV